ncbi:MAG TPA: NrtA/SsuA/CpmA family ABC transporter substrate-binding protein [Anaeromyxobacter sp.]|nr:NrtA/SsuA/CpmA family ABC transporter substrate-binding protein [Anaeromyxobacter sp.]
MPVARRWLLASLALAACAPGRRERLVVGGPHLPALGLVFVAQAKGYFAAHGLEVEYRRFTSGRDAVAALGSGRIDAAVSFETPIVLRAAHDPSLRVLTTVHVSSGNTSLVAGGDRGIAEASDLAGKRVGVPRNTNAEYFLDLLLAWGGVDQREVRLVDVAPEAAADALASGDVDAVAIWTPHAERARRMSGPRGAVEIRSDVYTELSMLATREPVLAARRGAFVKLVAALADAERLVRERPGEAFAAVRAEFPEASEAELAEAWRRIRPTLGLTHHLAASLEDESRWFRAAGRTDGPPVDVGVLLEPDVLAEVDPEAVTFVPPPRRAGAR